MCIGELGRPAWSRSVISMPSSPESSSCNKHKKQNQLQPSNTDHHHRHPPPPIIKYLHPVTINTISTINREETVRKPAQWPYRIHQSVVDAI